LDKCKTNCIPDILPDGIELVAKMCHSRGVEDNPREHFTRIKRVDVEALEPLRPKPAE
jgi:hypothetical protein